MLKFLMTIILMSTLSFAMAAIPDQAPFKKVFIIIFENAEADKALAQPTFSALAQEGAYLNNMHAIIHPSQPNYIALTSGDTQGITDDKLHDIDSKNIVDLLEAQGISWKVYAEDYPGNCNADNSIGKYSRTHNPFISYNNIRNNTARCARIVNADQLDKDMQSGSMPDYAFYIPNKDNNGHDTDVAYADTWLKNTFVPRFANTNFMQDRLIIITFDEGDTKKSKTAENKIYTLLYGTMINKKIIQDEYNHYSLLRTLEDAWKLGTLGMNDKTSAPIIGAFKIQK